MLISVAIAVHNEEKNILKCLKSVYNWTDEIIIVDSKSTDKTVELIKQFYQKNKIKIFKEDNPRMFHINKQKAIERCQEDWILQLDADEIVSEELKREILEIVGVGRDQPENRSVAYYLPRLNFFLGQPLRKGGQYPDYTIRLYRKGVARFPCESVHEQVEITENSNLKIKNLKLEIGYLKYPLLHYPYPTFKEYLRKWNFYNNLEAEKLRQEGFKPLIINFVSYFIILPADWFLKTYFRHLGFLDGIPGFVFSFFSAIRYWGIYVNVKCKSQNEKIF